MFHEAIYLLTLAYKPQEMVWMSLANYLKPSLAHLREPRHNFFKIVVAPLPTKRLENDERDFC
jgi:hypothetical protein